MADESMMAVGLSRRSTTVPNQNPAQYLLIYEYQHDTGKLGGRRRCILNKAVERLDMRGWVQHLHDKWQPGRYRIEFRDYRNVLVRGGVRAITVRSAR